MAVIGNIRKHSGLIVIVVGVALAAFVLGDLLQNKPSRAENNIGEINGEEVSIIDFNARFDQNIEAELRNRQVESLTPTERFDLQQRTWQQILYDYIMGNEYDELGLDVTSEELYELVQGANPHQYIVQIFTNPQNGQFDRTRVLNYLEALRQNQVDQETIDWWVEVEKAIKQDQQRIKYNNLILNGYYMPLPFSEMKYIEDNKEAIIRITGKKYHLFPDSLINITDADLEKYYDEHKEEYEQEASVDIDYVIFEVLPSEEDYNHVEEDVAEIFEEFKITENIPTFVNATSDNRYDSIWYAAGMLPLTIDSLMHHSHIGTFVPPYFEDNAFHMAKLIDITRRPDSMKASHILIAYNGALRADQSVSRTKEAAQKLSDSLFNMVKTNSSSFDNLVTKHSDDPSAAQNKGDLGWFADQTMVYDFNEAVLNGRVGQFELVESPFGYHIIKITGKKAPVKKVRVAMIDRAVEPSSKTYQEIYTAASVFAGENNTEDKFEDAVIDQGLVKRSAPKTAMMANNIAGLDYPRTIIRWAFSDNVNPGDISPVFDLGGKYVVALLKERYEKGFKPLEEIRGSIENIVKREKKGKVIAGEMEKQSGNIYQIASGLDSKVDTVTINFGSTAIKGVGSEPKVVATAFTIDQGVLSKPIIGRTGVFRIIVDQELEPSGTNNYEPSIRNILSTYQRKVEQNAPYEAIEKEADIVDNRVIYY
jgi:peptidyl-prolyl cis-trans isomerase D